MQLVNFKLVAGKWKSNMCSHEFQTIKECGSRLAVHSHAVSKIDNSIVSYSEMVNDI